MGQYSMMDDNDVVALDRSRAATNDMWRLDGRVALVTGRARRQPR